MDIQQAMARLFDMGDEKRKKVYAKKGAGDNQFGVLMGSLRALAKEIGRDNALALALWDTENTDARMLAAMIIDPSQITRAEAEALVASVRYDALMDELIFSAIAEAPFAPELKDAWMHSPDDWIGRAGWALVVAELLDKKGTPEDFERIIAIVEEGLVEAPPHKQWHMNRALCEIGIHHPAYTERCLKIGERLGVYRDLKVSKGCTSAFAPNWINVGIKNKRR